MLRYLKSDVRRRATFSHRPLWARRRLERRVGRLFLLLVYLRLRRWDRHLRRLKDRQCLRRAVNLWPDQLTPQEQALSQAIRLDHRLGRRLGRWPGLPFLLFPPP